MDKKSILANNVSRLSAKLGAASTSQLRAFARHYAKELLVPDIWHALGNHYVTAALKFRGIDGLKLKTVLAAIREAKDAGFEPKSVPGFKFAFVEVTSKTLLKQGQVEFPAEVNVDLAVDTVKADLDKALTNSTAANAKYVIVFDVAFAKATRRITTKNRIPSKFVAAYRTQRNPEYNLAQNLVNQSQIEVQSASMNRSSVSAGYCEGLGCLGKIFAQVAARKRTTIAQNSLQESMSNLQNTPMTIEVPVYKNYYFDRATVKATKLMTVHVAYPVNSGSSICGNCG